MADPVGGSTPTPDTAAPVMSDRDWWTLRKLIQENVDRYEHEPNLQSVRDGLNGALAYMDGCEQYRSMDAPAARSVAGTAVPEGDWCNCQAIPETENYPGPWHPTGDPVVCVWWQPIEQAEAGSGTAALTDKAVQRAAVALSTYTCGNPDQWKFYVDHARLALEAAQGEAGDGDE